MANGPGRDLGPGDEARARPVHVEHGLLQKVVGAGGLARLPQKVAVESGRERVIHRPEGGVAPGIAFHGNVGFRSRRHGHACTTEGTARDG